ncbi:uncharacterized protein LOC124637840 [Helicoverpa zea]|uniref:uncharacterized protein LOC124637840 n=1 Tax=Helicoverpa zea TaxID=7113 RepID=UPI001F58951C|nr:uncharacterized protein LOC124637840 [Helicoverpa zea]
MSSEDKKVVIEEHQLSSISITARIPEFWKKSPRTWFIQAEAVLNPQKMSDESKYQVLISKLPPDAVEQVTQILVDPPEKNKYETLKNKLIFIYQESEERQVKKLIGEMELGDQKPSQLLRKMQDLARGRVNNETLIVMWQKHLPNSVRGVLAVTEEKDLEKLASIADKIMETTTPIHSVATVKQEPGPSGSQDQIISAINKLSDRLQNLESRSRGRSNNWRRNNFRRNRSRSGSRSRTRKFEDPNWLCFYHYKYRSKATKCVDPCNWKKKHDKDKPAEN